MRTFSPLPHFLFYHVSILKMNLRVAEPLYLFLFQYGLTNYTLIKSPWSAFHGYSSIGVLGWLSEVSTGTPGD